jgi:MFS family permease
VFISLMAIPERALPRKRAEQGFRFVLSQPAFRLIWLAQVAAQLADKFLMFSLIILAYNLSGASTQVAITLLAYTVPTIAIGPPAGVFADRHNRKLIMVVTNFARAFIVLLIPLAAMVPGLRHDFWHLLLLIVLFSSIGQFFSPAEAAAIPTVLPKQAFLTANSMVLMTMVLTLVVGGTLAPLVSRLDLYAPYWWATLLFVVAGTLILFAHIPRTAALPRDPNRHPFHQFAMELRHGAEVLATSPVLLVAFSQVSLAVLVMFMMFTLAPAFAKTVIGIPPEDSYLILVPATLGAILSAVLLGQFGRRLKKHWLLVGSLLATGMTLLALASVPILARQVLSENTRIFAATFSFLLGLEFGGLMIPSITYLMEETADTVRGRIFSLLFTVVNGATAVPVLVAAALADTLGTNRVIGGLGLLLALSGVGVATFARRVFAPAAGR